MRFFSRVCFFTVALLVGAGLLFAVLPPQKAWVKEDFDLRVPKPGMTPVFKEAALTGGQRAALSRWESTLGGRLRYSLNQVGGIPRNMFRYEGPLTGPSAGDAVAAARDFLRAHRDVFLFTDKEIDEMEVVRNAVTEHNGSRVVWLNQVYDSIPVFGGYVRFVFDRQGRIWSVDTATARPGISLTSTMPALTAGRAVELAAKNVSHAVSKPVHPRGVSAANIQTIDVGDSMQGDALGRLALYTTGEGARLAWQVVLDVDPVQWYLMMVDAQNGEILSRLNLYQFAQSGVVWNCEHPDTWNDDGRGCARTQVSFAATPQSHDGWLGTPDFVGTHDMPYWNYPNPDVYLTIPFDYEWTQGNNVDVKEDIAEDGDATIGTHANGGPTQDFVFSYNDYWGTTGNLNQALLDLPAIQANAFYWVNTYHDFVYSAGFTEPWGNFQVDNFNMGGDGFDWVLANVPASIRYGNNSSFGTPPDGYPGRGTFLYWAMYAYSDIADAGVFMHELSHGTSTRLVCGPGANACLAYYPQSEAIGEAEGDFFPFTYFDDPIVGAYAAGDTGGLRLYPYSLHPYPRNYENLCEFKMVFPDTDGCESHYDGEILDAMLWDFKENVGDRDIATRLMVDALKMCPWWPTFLDLRDALLMADQLDYNGAYSCAIWDAAAEHGMGYNATAAPIWHYPDFNIPDYLSHPACLAGGFVRYDSNAPDDSMGGNGDGILGPGEMVNLTITLQNREGVRNAQNVSAVLSTDDPGIVVYFDTSSYPTIPTGGTANNVTPYVFAISPNYPCGKAIEFKLHEEWDGAYQRDEAFKVAVGTNGQAVWQDTVEAGGVFTPAGMWTVSPDQNHTPSGSLSYYSGTGTDSQCATLTSPPLEIPYTTSFQGAELSFWVKYNLEYNWDGLIVQVSDNRGRTWEKLEVGYNGTMYSNNGCGFDAKSTSITGPNGNMAPTDWTLFRGDLTRYAGRKIYVRFIYMTDAAYTVPPEDGGGAYIDDIQVRTTDCKAAPYASVALTGAQVSDGLNASCTDNDGYADPGETVDYGVTLTNTGTVPLMNTQVRLLTTDANISGISMGPVSFGNINVGATASGTFRFSVVRSPSVNCEENAPLTLAVIANGGANTFQIDYPLMLRADPYANGGTPGQGFWDSSLSGTPFGLDGGWTASLGPDGTAQDWHLFQFAINCCGTAGDRFWATNPNMNPTQCATGDPDYSADSDSLLTSPPIDLGYPNQTIHKISWQSFFYNYASRYGNTQADGFSQVLIDHDGDGIFTPLITAPNGLGDITEVDVQNNPEGSIIDPADTAQVIRIQFRFRAYTDDMSHVQDSSNLGWTIGQVTIDWYDTEGLRCDMVPCGPGIMRSRVVLGGGPVSGDGGIGGNVPGALPIPDTVVDNPLNRLIPTTPTRPTCGKPNNDPNVGPEPPDWTRFGVGDPKTGSPYLTPTEGREMK
jgi:hypothetical protein